MILPKMTWCEVDHRNGDGLDNRRDNLRYATRARNTANRASVGGSSRFKGVSWSKRDKIWYANICVNYRTIYLGTYRNEEDAARAYDAAAKKYFGAFARPNFP